MRRYMQLFLGLLIVISPVWAEGLVVDITKGTISEISIAFSPFSVKEKAFLGKSKEQEVAQQIQEVVRNDLVGSGLFRAIDSRAFIQTDFTQGVRFSDWRMINAQVLVTGSLEFVSSDRFILNFDVYDVFSQEKLTTTHLEIGRAGWRRAAHRMADIIYERVTGEKGYFDTRIVYVAKAKNRNGTIYTRLAVMDQDGANHQYLTDRKKLVMTPRFSPTLHQITYLDFGDNWKTPRVYLMDTMTGKSQKLGEFKGMTFAPRFSPDGKSVIMSYSNEDTSCLYNMDLSSKKLVQLTYGTSIDVSGCYSPDGKEIVFNSDRSGDQQLYIMNANGQDVRRISFGEGRYASPVWSPRGDLIAFTKMLRGQFYIGVMRTDGSGERLIARGYLVEEPSWAPNGRVLIYGRKDYEGQDQKLYRIDLTGFNDREIPTPAKEEALSAAWSPLLP